ncbi:MAG: NAD(P)/FAD-dependent oxidoreductase [Candidatus Nanohaloarchaea archaeon]
MPEHREADIVVIGGGVGGSYAAATAAYHGLDVFQLERKSEEEAGHIACGDATKSPLEPEYFPGDAIDMESIVEDPEIGFDYGIDQIEWWDTSQEGVDIQKTLRYPDQGERTGSSVVDRYEFGQALLEQAAERGAEQEFGTVVQELLQGDRVEGVRAAKNGDEILYHADVTIDASGALSDFNKSVERDGLDAQGGVTLEEPHFTQMGSAYREIIETRQPVDYDNAIIGMPLEGSRDSLEDTFGYFWLFPRSDTEVNVGLGFQMSDDPIQMVDVLRDYVEDREEFQDAEIDEKFGKKNKLGSALALRRPLDSLVAPGYLAAGGNACCTHPISGKGIRGAAVTGYSAGKHAAEAIETGDVSEEGLWDHNVYVMKENGIGKTIASRDPFNIAAGTVDVDSLRAFVSFLPEEEIQRVVGSGGDSSLRDELGVIGAAWRNYRERKADGTLESLDVSRSDIIDTAWLFGAAKMYSRSLENHYSEYPENREGFPEWKEARDEIDSFYQGLMDADPKYGGDEDTGYMAAVRSLGKALDVF